MPYISFKTTLELDDTEKHVLSSEIMQRVNCLPGKPPERTMVHIEDKCQIFRNGEVAVCAFVETIFQRPIDFTKQKEYIESLYSLFLDRLGLEAHQIYFAMIDLDTWGTRGTLQKTT